MSVTAILGVNVFSITLAIATFTLVTTFVAACFLCLQLHTNDHAGDLLARLQSNHVFVNELADLPFCFAARREPTFVAGNVNSCFVQREDHVRDGMIF
jgi:hypothetical protein